MSAKLSVGHMATVYHAGTDSYYQAVIIKPMSKRAVAAESAAACGEDPRPPVTIFRDTLKQCLKDFGCTTSTLGEIYADKNKAKTTVRLKLYRAHPLLIQKQREVRRAMQRAFGAERLIEMDFVPDWHGNWCSFIVRVAL